MKKGVNSQLEGKIIVFGETVVNGAIADWMEGNEGGDPELIEKSNEKLNLYKDIFPAAKYFASVAKIQLRDDELEGSLKSLFEALEVLLEDDNADKIQLLKSCHEILNYLAENDGYFEKEEKAEDIPKLEDIKFTIERLTSFGVSGWLLAKLFSQLKAYLGR